MDGNAMCTRFADLHAEDGHLDAHLGGQTPMGARSADDPNRLFESKGRRIQEKGGSALRRPSLIDCNNEAV